MHAFLNKLHSFYEANKRDTLPWRKTHDTYKILLSEIMLQQTQVPRVLTKYQEFLKLFPNAKALAGVPLRDVLTAWQGLGYNRRAKFLHQAAKLIAEAKPKQLESYDFLRSLPGVGQSTAGAVLAFTKDMPVAFIETNIRAVILHEFFTDTEQKISDTLVLEKLNEMLNNLKGLFTPREFYYALYDYGTHLKSTLGKQKKSLHAKSTHYVKQSRFEGSRRQLRAFILKTFLEMKDSKRLFSTVKKNKPMSLKGYSDQDIKTTINDLKTEGFFA